MIALLLWLQIESSLGVRPIPAAVGTTGDSRTYHGVSLANVKDTQWTHIAVCARVQLVKTEADGDVHIRLGDGVHVLIVEMVPYHRLPIPTVGRWVRVAGIHRYDKQHRWEEIHPAEAITVVGSCAMSPGSSP